MKETPGSSAFTIVFDEAGDVKSKFTFLSEVETLKPHPSKTSKVHSKYLSRRSSCSSLNSPSPDGLTRAYSHSSLMSKEGDSKAMQSESSIKDSTTMKPFQALITQCSKLQGSVVNSWQEASSNISTSRSSFSNLSKKVGSRVPTSWNQSAVYLSGKDKIKAILAQQTAQKIGKHVTVVKSVLEDPGCKEHIYLSPKDLNSKNILQLLQINRRSFGGKKPPKLRLSERSSPENTKRTERRRESMDEVLMKEIEEYKKDMLPQIDIDFNELPKKFRAAAIAEQERLFSELELMSPLNQLILKQRKKFMPRLRSQLNYRRNAQLEARMEKIHPSKQVVERAVGLMLSRTSMPKPLTFSDLPTPKHEAEAEYEPIDFTHKLRMETLLRKKFRGTQL
mmetsp:Transcript_26156/g.46526  ORF Transcript_26156/g.46526 Transcript_26156/m.46526 type:complete len:393 (+) Transcript_26156:4995-6173(+)